ncbi:MAG TPA: hypothetical protein VEU98_03085, partial [Candidatus Eremiobacteraceae bacterium]|nr:hypothetical protein [Candidatus Eremiobacteraceae bacterium]
MEADTATDAIIPASAARTEKRIAWLTLFFGGTAALAAISLGNRLWASGLIIGATLGWINFRLLGHGLDGLVLQSIAQRERKK